MKHLSQHINFPVTHKLLYVGIIIFFFGAFGSCKKSDNQQAHGIPLQAINLASDTLNIMLGAQAAIVYKLVPSNTTDTVLTFTSSASSIATVQAGGLVTGVALGSTKITISNAATKLSATCVVNVVPVRATSMQMSKTTLGMNPAQKDTLSVSFLPANAVAPAVTWSSSNTAVATVSATGVVTAVITGSATITASATGGKLSATCLVTVVPLQATSLQISKTTLGMNPAQMVTLSVAFLPVNAVTQAVTWSSSNTAVATVNANGVVTAVTTGSATITVGTTGGKLSATCQVTVVPVVNVTGIKLDSTQFNLLNGTSLKMGYTVTPAGSSNVLVNWTSSNTTVATVQSDGTINGLTAGAANITATTAQGGYTSTCTVNVQTIRYFLDLGIVYSGSSATGQLVESVSFDGFNYALYDMVVSEIDIYNNENNLIGSLKNANGSPVFTLTHAAGGGLTSPAQSFIVSQVEPGATTDQQWPLVAYFTCNGVSYKMTLTVSALTIVQL
jgi:uncharacterized protein YjdB